MPVDVEMIARRLGLPIFPEVLPPGVAGALFTYPGGSIIVYDRRSSRQRARFTVAHELAHWLIGRSRPVALSHGAIGEGKRREERFADRFAAALLMPAPVVVDRWLSGEAFTSLAARFDVSLEAMHWRLVELGLV